MGQLDGKVVIVTGAAQGMGASHAARCVAEGANVVATDIQAEAGRASVEPLGNAARFVAHDVTEAESWASVLAEATQAFGQLDGLVNNAAILPEVTTIEDESPEVFERAWRVNVLGTWLGIKTCIPALRNSGGGSIVNVSSTAGMRGLHGFGSYGASKWAVRGLTKVASRELGPDDVRVNSIHPGGVDQTGMFTAPSDPDQYRRFYRDHPLGRPGTPDDISSLVVFLLSDASSWITGNEHVIDGGSIV